MQKLVDPFFSVWWMLPVDQSKVQIFKITKFDVWARQSERQPTLILTNK